jgi:hypothetical protein
MQMDDIDYLKMAIVLHFLRQADLSVPTMAELAPEHFPDLDQDEVDFLDGFKIPTPSPEVAEIIKILDEQDRIRPISRKSYRFLEKAWRREAL